MAAVIPFSYCAKGQDSFHEYLNFYYQELASFIAESFNSFSFVLKDLKWEEGHKLFEADLKIMEFDEFQFNNEAELQLMEFGDLEFNHDAFLAHFTNYLHSTAEKFEDDEWSEFQYHSDYLDDEEFELEKEKVIQRINGFKQIVDAEITVLKQILELNKK